MIRGWGRSLLFKVAIGAVVLFALLSCLQSASAVDIEVTPKTPVKILFDQPKQPGDTVHESAVITITNHGKNETVVGISDSPGFTSIPPTTIPAGQHREVRI